MAKAATLNRPTRKLINRGNVYQSESYLSNGHWLIRKDRLTAKSLELVKAQNLVRDMPEASMAKVVPERDYRMVPWTVTDQIGSSRGDTYRLLYNEGRDEYAGINVLYCDWLGLTPGAIAHSRSSSESFLTANGDVVMPLRDVSRPEPIAVSTMHGKSIAELTDTAPF
jgi:hypothetical protein